MKDKLLTHGRTFHGRVIADRMQKTVTVEWDRRKYLPKFERYEKRRTRVKAHNPEHVNAKVGQKVEIKETRPISKTKNFIVTKILEEAEGEEKEAPKQKKDKAKPKKKKGEKDETEGDDEDTTGDEGASEGEKEEKDKGAPEKEDSDSKKSDDSGEEE